MVKFFTLLIIATFLLPLLLNVAVAAPPLQRACNAPPLPSPGGTIITVSTESALQVAVNSITSGTTIMVQPGTYNLTSTLWLNRNVDNVAIRGSTDSCDDVVLIGRGMSNPSYGNVPHGIWIGNARNVLVANLTIREVYYHPIQLDPNAGAQAPRIYNVRLIDAGEQFVKSSARTSGTSGVNNGVVEYSVMEYTTTARSNYTNGVDVHQGANWIVRHNLFRNIRAPAGQLAGPAVLMWNGSRDSIVENNLFLNVQYGIALGLNGSKADDHLGGIVRNNFFHRNSSQSGDVGITINNSASTKVLHNTVILSGTYPNAIEYRFSATTGVEIRYNLTDGAVQQRDGAMGTVANNVTSAQSSWFVNAATGDLHLAAIATAAIDKAAAHPSVATDYDAETRPQGPAPDIGADEFSLASQAPEAPTNVRVTP